MNYKDVGLLALHEVLMALPFSLQNNGVPLKY